MYNFQEEHTRIGADLQNYLDKGKKIFSTSSFQPQSVVLLHILHTVAPETPVFFLNTGYHFPKTLAFKNDFIRQFPLNVVDLYSSVPRSQQRDHEGKLMFTVDPDYCCFMNKVQPLDPVLMEYDVWINGIRRGQNANRAKMKVEEKSKYDSVRYHPILEWDQRMVFSYLNEFQLPHHPMMAEGYMSVGCEPCTRRQNQNNSLDDRDGRWAGMSKTECGLHTELVVK